MVGKLTVTIPTNGGKNRGWTMEAGEKIPFLAKPYCEHHVPCQITKIIPGKLCELRSWSSVMATRYDLVCGAM